MNQHSYKQHILFLLILVMLPLFTHANQSIQPYTAEYSGEYKGMNILLKRTLSKTGKTSFTIENSAKNMLASLYESSQFKLVNSTHVKPERYQYITQYGPIKRAHDVRFNWTNKIAQDKKHPSNTVALTSQATDRISYQESLRQLVKSGKRGTMSLDVVSKGKLKTYTFETQTEQSIQTPAGKLMTIPLKRLYADKNKNKSQTIWLAKDHDFILAKLEQKKGNEVYSINLKRFSLN